MSDINQPPHQPATPSTPADQPGQTIFEREVREMTEEGGEDAARPDPAPAGGAGGNRMAIVVVAIVVVAAALWVVFS